MNYVGIENEFTVLRKTKAVSGVKSAAFLPEKLLSGLPVGFLILVTENDDDQSGLVVRITPHNRVWLANGGCVYRDARTVEYASPECLSIKDLVLAEKAGDIVLHEFCKQLDEDKDNVYLLKRSTSEDMGEGHTWGAHENYAVTEKMFYMIMREPRSLESELFKFFVASRFVFAGAGHVGFFAQDGKLRFWVSPRMQYIKKEIDEMTRSGNRSLINTRDDEEFMQEGWKRLHMIAGDMNRSDWSSFLKLGATFLFLRFLQISKGPDLKKLLNSVMGLPDLLAHAKAASLISESVVPMEFLNLIDMQCKFLEAVRGKKSKLEESVPEFIEICDSWGGALDAAQTIGENNNVFSRRLDWLIKKKFIEERFGISIFEIGEVEDVATRKKILSADFSYSRVSNKDLYRFLVDNDLAEEKYSLETARRYCLEPPEGKAERRVEVVRYVEKLGFITSVYDIRYNSISFKRATSLYTTTDMKVVRFDEKTADEIKSEIASSVCGWLRGG